MGKVKITRNVVRNGDIAYCGSWTQITIAEFEIKGGLIWEWNGTDYESTFVEIPNPYRFETVKIKDFSSFDIKKIIPASKNTTYRFLYIGDEDKFSTVEFNEVKKSFSKAYIDNPVILQKNYAKKKTTTTTVDINKAANVTVDYIKKYFDKKDISPELQPLLIALDNNFSKQLDLSDYQTGEYLIKKLTIHNFLSYGPNNVLDWSNLQGLVGLFGKSTLGKSSIPLSILFCLFNKTPKDSSSVSKLINDQIADGEKAFVELTLVILGNTWRIKRTIVPGKTPKVLLEVYETVDGVEVERHDESRPKTDVILKKLIGDEQTFLSTVFYTHKSPEFVDNKNAQRLDLMSRFLGLQSYEQKFSLADTVAKEHEVSYKVLAKQLENLIDETSLNKKKDELLIVQEENKQKLSQIESDDSKLKDERDLLDEDLKAFDLIGVFKTEEDVLKEIELLEQSAAKLSKIVSSSTVELEEQKVLWKTNSPKIKVDKWEINFDEIVKATNELNKTKNLLKDWEDKLTDSVCKTCKQPIKDLNKEEANLQIVKYKKLVTEQSSLLTTIETEQKLLQSLQTTIAHTQSTIQLNQTKIENTGLKIDVLKSELSIIKDNALKIKQKEKILAEIQKNVYEKQEQIKSRATVENEQKNCVKEISLLKTKIEEYKTLKIQTQEANNKVSLYSAYKAMMHKTGIPLLVLDAYIPYLNQEVNEYIYELFDFNLNFEVKDNALEMSFAYDKQMTGSKGVRDVLQASGMEGTIINLVTRAALYKISSLPKPSFLILDEIFTTMDSDSLEKLREMLTRLKTQYSNILIISHIDDIKDLPEHNIALTKTRGVTTIL